MPNEAQEQINLLSQQRDRLMKSLQETQSDIRSDRIISDTFVDTDALNFAVHSALSKALTKNTSDDHSRFQRTISDLQDRLSAAELHSRRTQESLMHAVMQGISQIGVVTGHLRSGSAKTGFDEPHRRQILSLLENASKTLRNIPECSEADHVASSIVEAAHELVGAFINVQILNDKMPSFPSTSSPSPDVNSEKALQLNCVGHAAALQYVSSRHEVSVEEALVQANQHHAAEVDRLNAEVTRLNSERFNLERENSMLKDQIKAYPTPSTFKPEEHEQQLRHLQLAHRQEVVALSSALQAANIRVQTLETQLRTAQNISSVSHTSVVSEYDLQQLRDELSAAQRRADNAELMLLTTSDILRSDGQQSQMTAVERTSKLLDKLQQVEAIGEGARQAIRQENVELAAHEEELLEKLRVLQIENSSKANQLLRAEKRFRDFEEIVSQTNDQYQRQLFSLREHLLTVEKQRDAKVAEALAWAARLQEVQDECNTQLSYQQIEIQALHQRSHILAQELQEAQTVKFDFEAMESAHVQRYVQLQGQYDEYRLAQEMREGEYSRMQVALDDTLERLVAVSEDLDIERERFSDLQRTYNTAMVRFEELQQSGVQEVASAAEAGLRSSLRTVQERMRLMATEQSSMQRTLLEKQERLGLLSDSIVQLQRSLVDEETRNARLQDEVAHLRQQLASAISMPTPRSVLSEDDVQSQMQRLLQQKQELEDHVRELEQRQGSNAHFEQQLQELESVQRETERMFSKASDHIMYLQLQLEQSQQFHGVAPV